MCGLPSRRLKQRPSAEGNSGDSRKRDDEMKKTHHHQLIQRDENGGYYLSLLCPTCEAAGVTVSDNELREGLLRVEEFLQREGSTLTDVIAEESLPEIYRLLGRVAH
jgi:hypothetical protein